MNGYISHFTLFSASFAGIGIAALMWYMLTGFEPALVPAIAIALVLNIVLLYRLEERDQHRQTGADE